MGKHLTAATPQEKQRRAEVHELRSNRIGVLIQIIDDLDAMGLTAQEIDTVLLIAGLNQSVAYREGSIIRGNKEYGRQVSPATETVTNGPA